MLMSVVVLILLVLMVDWFLFRVPIPMTSEVMHERRRMNPNRRIKSVSEHRGVWDMPNLAIRRAWFADGDNSKSDEPPVPTIDDIDLEGLPEMTRLFIESQERRIRELNNESASRRHQLNELSAKVESLTSAQRKQLEADGQYKALYEQQLNELSTLKLQAERAQAYEQQIKASNESKIARIPDMWKDAIPDLPPDKLSAWLDANIPKFTAPIAPDIGAGTSTGGSNAISLTPEQELAYKSGGFESKEEYIKFMKKAGMM